MASTCVSLGARGAALRERGAAGLAESLAESHRAGGVLELDPAFQTKTRLALQQDENIRPVVTIQSHAQPA